MSEKQEGGQLSSEVTAGGVQVRGEEMLRAKNLRLSKERERLHISTRLDAIAAEEAKLQQKIQETRLRAKERTELANRVVAIKKVEDQTKQWMGEELVQRRQAMQEIRRQTKGAIEQKRLAMLKSRHEDFVALKRDAEDARATILAARAKKLEQARVRSAAVRKDAEIAKARNSVLAKARMESLRAQTGIETTAEASAVRATQQHLERLAAEEARLLKSVLAQHGEHRRQHRELHERAPAFSRGVTSNPSRLSLSSPLTPDNPLFSRRPLTSSPRPPGTPRSLFGNSAPSSPRTLLSTLGGSRSRPVSAASNRSDLLNGGVTPAKGRTCAMSSPNTFAGTAG